MLEKSKNNVSNKRPTFWETMLLLTLKRQDFVDFFFNEKLCKTILDPELEQEPEPEIDMKTLLLSGRVVGFFNWYFELPLIL